MEERFLAEQLIAYETYRPDEISRAAGFIKGWFDSKGVLVDERNHNSLPLLTAEVGATAADAPTVVFHGHIDVVPANPGQFQPRIEGDRLIGRGSYDMKGGLSAMMCAVAELANQDAVKVIFVCAPDEESEEVEQRSTDALLRDAKLHADFAITGEPTDLHVGIQAKGVLALRIKVLGLSAHGSTPWLGDNAVLKAIDTFRAVESLPFSRESSEMFDRPSINLGRIAGGDALNRVPDVCNMDIDVRYLPGQDPDLILEQISALDGIEVARTFTWPPATVQPDNAFVGELRSAISKVQGKEALSVGRDGASDAASFIEHGIPAVEFGPVGAGHHGPEEWVSISSLSLYRRALTEFVAILSSGAR